MDPLPLTKSVPDIPHTMTSSETLPHLNDAVVAVYVACHHPTTREVTGRAVNHWRFYLSTSLGDPARGINGSSVLIDMLKKSPPDMTGVLGVVAKDYPTSINVAHTIGCATSSRSTVTVYQIIKLLHDKGLLRYKYATSGEGCRFWVKTAVRALEDAGLLAAGAAARVDAAVPFLWTRGQNEVFGASSESPIESGTFY